MNEKINADLKSLKFIFDKNKPYILPIVIMLSCIILFWQFVIPQFKTLLKAQKDVRQASERLQMLKENLNVLKNTDEKTLDGNLKTLSLALPLAKDFTGILNSIYYASQKTGVGLGSFSLQIGDILSSEKKDDFPKISVSIPINANTVGVESFVKTISKTVPLSEVTLIKIRNTASSIEASFYYKPLGASPKEDLRINPTSQKGLSIINQLKSFENISFQNTPISTSSSQSSTPF